MVQAGNGKLNEVFAADLLDIVAGVEDSDVAGEFLVSKAVEEMDSDAGKELLPDPPVLAQPQRLRLAPNVLGQPGDVIHAVQSPFPQIRLSLDEGIMRGERAVDFLDADQPLVLVPHSCTSAAESAARNQP